MKRGGPYTGAKQQTRARPQPQYFPRALKDVRLARHLKQEALAALLHVNERTLASWLTGERLPTISMVLYLNRQLFGDDTLDTPLMRAYLRDDLHWQLNLQQDEQIRREMQAILAGLEQREQANEAEAAPEEELPLPLFGGPAEQASEAGRHAGKGQDDSASPTLVQGTGNEALQQLFALLDVLRGDPALVPVVQDFLREITGTTSSDVPKLS